jgi:hypothetical protein
MSAGKLKLTATLVLFIVILSIAIPVPVMADGGPIVPHDLWADLKEGHQIAVVTILNQDSARVDLFISILDKTEQSHEMVFFVPIGKKSSSFSAMEEDLFTFDKATTRNLDDTIRQRANDRKYAVQVLFSGALLTNGAWLIPFWSPVLLTGCGAAEQKPETTLQTASSQISIYGIDENTDLAALVQTTGLPASVSATLAKLQGQQIAVVKLQTKPEAKSVENPAPGQPAATEPGLHLSWNTSFVPAASGPTYTYPLGTGGAWSKPIELTRVYIVAPKGTDFNVTYPAIGSEQSGFDIIEGAHITNFIDTPSYAVDEARGDFGRVWRATYTQSNPTDDIVITVKAQSGFSQFLAGAEDAALPYSFPFALVIGILIWVLAWHYLMPRFLGEGSRQQARLRWPYALIYPAINIVFIIFPGSILYLLFLMGMTIPALTIQFLIGGGVTIGFFTLIHGKRLGVSRGKAIRAFIFTSLAGSAAYLVLAVVFAKIVNAI